MQIIPVIDLMGGIVVHAKAGVRQHYRPLASTLTESVEPIEVIAALMSYQPFSTIYIADLDAITAGTDNRLLYQQIINTFPGITVWLDAGITTCEQREVLAAIPRVIPIVASESWSDSQSPSWDKTDILSLDFKHDTLLGDDSFLQHPSTWPDTVIAMNLDYIGEGKGPDIALLQKLKSIQNNRKLVAAGGVRNEQDLTLLARQGVSAVLVASALHNGALSKAVLKKYN